MLNNGCTWLKTDVSAHIYKANFFHNMSFSPCTQTILHAILHDIHSRKIQKKMCLFKTLFQLFLISQY